MTYEGKQPHELTMIGKSYNPFHTLFTPFLPLPSRHIVNINVRIT